jgi:hypothetical protein
MGPPWRVSIWIYSTVYEVAVRASSHIGAGELALALACASAVLAACAGGDGVIGATCTERSDCLAQLQCFEELCRPACHAHPDCGDGYRCDDGECEVVSSSLGASCFREIECGPGQTCAPDRADFNGDGTLTGTCTVQEPGKVLGDECASDDECQTQMCSLGRCAQMCAQITDCPGGLTCARVPRAIDDTTPRLGACMQGSGVVEHRLELPAPGATIQVPVPSNAVSFAVVSLVDDPAQLVGAWRVVGPGGVLLYQASAAPGQFYQNVIRYQPSPGVSTLLVPNTPAVDLANSIYEVDIGSRFPDGSLGSSPVHVRILYKVDTAATLDLHFHFLSLADHPCAAAFDEGVLDASSAPVSQRFQTYVDQVRRTLGEAGILLSEPTFSDVVDRADLDSIDRARAGELFALGREPTGVDVFLVRSISPVGVQVAVNATPGPPRTNGTSASGVAIAMDTLCYQGWPDLARLTAHAIARQMGLYYSRDPNGYPDPIPDTDESVDNLLYFGDQGGWSLSRGQAQVLSRYPGLR